MRPRLPLSLAVGAATLSIASAEVGPPRYHVTDLGTLPGGSSSEAFAISDSGVIAGESYADDQFGLGIRAFGWSNGGMTSLAARQVHGGLPHSGLAVNESGAIVGPVDNNLDSFMFQNGLATRLSIPAGSLACVATGVSPANVVVGSITVPIGGGQYQAHAFRMDGATLTDLNDLFGRDYSGANAINEDGVIVGETRIAGAGLPIHGFIVDGEEVTILGTLGGSNSEAVAINNLGIVAGNSYLADLTEHAFIYADGEMTDLGILAGAQSSLARAINIDNTVVGYCTFPGYSPDRAFVYSDGQMQDLNTLIDNPDGFTLEAANGINEDGLIVGRARLSNGTHHAVLLTPIATCPADIDANGTVDLGDLGVVLSCFGASPCGDLDGNGTTDLSDLGIILADFGMSCQ